MPSRSGKSKVYWFCPSKNANRVGKIIDNSKKLSQSFDTDAVFYVSVFVWVCIVQTNQQNWLQTLEPLAPKTPQHDYF